MKLLRKLLYYALWPLGMLWLALASFFRFFGFLIIASNPLLLAFYLSRHRHRRRKEDET